LITTVEIFTSVSQMKPKKIHIFPVNRVEGDLEVRIEVENNRVSDAWSAGIMYRGFENLLIGRAILDGLVLTPRISGRPGSDPSHMRHLQYFSFKSRSQGIGYVFQGKNTG
jgi:hypothetical protein